MFTRYFPGKQQRANIKKNDSAHRSLPRHGDKISNPQTIYKFYARLLEKRRQKADERRLQLLATNTPAERAFQFILNEIGIDYEREHIVFLQDFSARFIDFYSETAKIGFEVDGGYHKERIEYDIDRDIGIMSLNILIVRFTNDEVLKDPEGTKAKIEATLWNRVAWWQTHGDYDRMAHWEANQPDNRHR